MPDIPARYLVIGAIVIISVTLFYFSKSVPTANLIYTISQAIDNPVLSDPEAPALKFSYVNFVFYNSPSDLGVDPRIPPGMVYCHNKLDQLEESGGGVGFARIAVKNVGNRPVALSTSTLHKTNEVQVDIYSEIERDNLGNIAARKSIFERICSEDGIIHFISNRQAGLTDPIMLMPGEQFVFLGILGTSKSKDTFCGRSYPINMAGTVNNGEEVKTYELESRVLTVRC